MGGRRRRRQVIRIPKKKLPKVFVCPKCGAQSIRVEMKSGIAIIKCGNCGLSGEVEVSPIHEEVDAYCKFTDLFYSGKLGGEK